MNYPRAPWILERDGYFDATDIGVVQKSFVMLNIFVGLERAVTDFHASSDASEAIGDLERLLAAVVDYNEEIEDTDMEYDIELMEDLRDVMLENGTPEPEIIEIDDDPWPAD